MNRLPDDLRNLVPFKKVYSNYFDEQVQEEVVEPVKEEKIEFTEQHKHAEQLFDNWKNIFITGAAGTGKTTLIRHLLSKRTNVLVCATTGVASLQYDNGSTLHAALKIPINYPLSGELAHHYRSLRATFDNYFNKHGHHHRRDIDPNDIKNPKVRWVYKINEIDTILIDEISMCSAYLLECVDTALRILRNKEKPFGGVQCVLVGDFLQLSPVYDKTQRYKDKNGIERGPPTNQGKLAFMSPVWKDLDIQSIHLTRVFRQEDTTFQTLLGKIRMDESLDCHEMDMLQSCQTRKRPADDVGIYIMHTRKQVHAFNLQRQRELGDVKMVTYNFPYSTVCSVDDDEYKGLLKQTSDGLQIIHGQNTYSFKVGDKVMIIMNGEYPYAEDHGEDEPPIMSTEKIRLVNGDIGFITNFTEEEFPVIQIFRNSKFYADIVAYPVELKRTRVDVNSEETEITLASINIIPAILAHAITVHKCQGCTLRDVSVTIDCTNLDWCQNAFYTALSRATSIERVYLEKYKGYRQSKDGIQFYRNFKYPLMLNESERTLEVEKKIRTY